MVSEFLKDFFLFRFSDGQDFFANTFKYAPYNFDSNGSNKIVPESEKKEIETDTDDYWKIIS